MAPTAKWPGELELEMVEITNPLNMHRPDDPKFISLTELLADARRDWPASPENPVAEVTDEELFVDIFHFGACHEEEPDWPVIAASLTKTHLCHLGLLGVAYLASFSCQPTAPSVAMAMRLHRALSVWHEDTASEASAENFDRLEQQAELIAAMDAARGAILASLNRSTLPYSMELIRLFSLADMGARCAFGNKSWDLYWLTREYEHAFARCARN